MQFVRFVRFSPAAVCMLLCGACAQGGIPATTAYGVPEGDYTHRVATSNLELYWNCTSSASGVVDVSGIVHNTSDGDVRFVDLNLVGVSGRRVVSEAKTSVQPVVLSLNETAPFLLQVHSGDPGAQFDLYYQYRRRFRPGGLFGDDLQQFSARDICSPTHLVAR